MALPIYLLVGGETYEPSWQSWYLYACDTKSHVVTTEREKKWAHELLTTCQQYYGQEVVADQVWNGTKELTHTCPVLPTTLLQQAETYFTSETALLVPEVDPV